MIKICRVQRPDLEAKPLYKDAYYADGYPPENLKQWQGGDIVVFGPPYDHVGVVSDKRRPDGVPLLIHNAGPCTSENDRLLTWPSPLKYHFRFPEAD